MPRAGAMTRVSVVLETDSVHAFDDVTITDCLEALARQDYPRQLIEVIAVDGGKVPALAAIVRQNFPTAMIIECPQWAVGYFMVRTRQLEPDLRGSALVRAAGLGWPLVVAMKLLRDLTQVWQHRRRVSARFAAALPLLLAFETTLFLGGLAALLRLPAPRVS